MKALCIICTVLGIVSALCIFYGFPLMIVNIGRDQKLMFIYMGVGIFGFVGICVTALLMMLNKKKQ